MIENHICWVVSVLRFEVTKLGKEPQLMYCSTFFPITSLHYTLIVEYGCGLLCWECFGLLFSQERALSSVSDSCT